MSNVLRFPIERCRQSANIENLSALWFAPLHFWSAVFGIMSSPSVAERERAISR
jgi:hypothetical protein